MATKSQAYDHPAYQTVAGHSGLSAVGANGVTTKWGAWTTMKIKAVTMTPAIATTASGSQPYLYSKSGTTTSTTTLTVLTSGAVTAISSALSTALDLNQGDIWWFTHGTDATAAVVFAAETVVTPGANLTV